MTIAVCLKWVSTRPEVNSLTGAVITDPRFSGFSPADLGALEWALRVRPDPSGSVVLLCAGPPEADHLLGQLAATGASRAVRIHAGPRSSSQIANLLAAEIVNLGDASLVICGDYSLDRGTGSVPAFIAHQLGWAQALGVVELRSDADGLTAERRLDQGRREVLSVAGPTVVSVEQGPELRRAGLAALMEPSLRVEVRQPAVAEAGDEVRVASTAPYVPRPRVIEAPTGETRSRVNALVGLNKPPKVSQRIKLDPEAAAELAAEQLVEWGYWPLPDS